MQHKPIVIVGGGPIGLTAALLLGKQGLNVTVLDAGTSKINDGRVLALSYASVTLLIELNVWPSGYATAINQVHISHSGLGITKMYAKDVHLPQLGYTIKYSDICMQLAKEVAKYPNIELCYCIVDEIISGNNYTTIAYNNEQGFDYLTTDMAIVADGGKIQIKDICYTEYNYQQTAIIAEIKTDIKHNNIAYERFDNAGAMVLLPHGDNYTMVWSMPTVEADTVLHTNNLAIHLNQLKFMKRFGNIDISNNLHSFNLKLNVAKTRATEHMVLIGNSSQVLHPVSAQGMNLGLRDALALSELLAAGLELDAAALAKFNQQRACDTKYVVGFTHGLARFMEQKSSLLGHLRGAGIIALSNCKPVQNFITNSLIFGA